MKKELELIDGYSWDKSIWSSSFKNQKESGVWGNSFVGILSNNLATTAVLYVGNYVYIYTKAINLTDVEQIAFTYKQYDNLYKPKTSGLIFQTTKIQKGINTTYEGIANAQENNTNFVKYTKTTYTRTSASDAVAIYTKTIDVSDLTG